MATEEKKEGMLTPYRVLDLTDMHGLLAGKLLGDLGADVIKIERPGGVRSHILIYRHAVLVRYRFWKNIFLLHQGNSVLQ